MLRLLLVDDLRLSREATRILIASRLGADVVEAETRPQAFSVFRKMKPDVVIIAAPLQRASAVGIIERLRAETRKTRILVLDRTGDVSLAIPALDAGANGFVSAFASTQDLIAGVMSVAAGKRYFDPVTAARLPADAMAPTARGKQRFSPREIEIMGLLARGKSLAAIAEAMAVSYKTIANNCSRLKKKTGASQTSDLVRLALQRGRE